MKKKKLGVSNTPYDGGWWVTDGSWWVTDGGWWVTDGGWWVTDGGCPTPCPPDRGHHNTRPPPPRRSRRCPEGHERISRGQFLFLCVRPGAGRGGQPLGGSTATSARGQRVQNYVQPPSWDRFRRGNVVTNLKGAVVPQRNPPPLCDIPSGRCSFTGPWTVTRPPSRVLRRIAAFCRPLRPVCLLWCRFRGRGAQWSVCRGCAGCGPPTVSAPLDGDMPTPPPPPPWAPGPGPGLSTATTHRRGTVQGGEEGGFGMTPWV